MNNNRLAFLILIVIAISGIGKLNAQNIYYMGAYPTPDGSSDVFIENNYAYIAEGMAGMRIVDITDPANPELVGTFVVPISPCNRVKIQGNYAYLAENYPGFQIVDITDPTNPVSIGSYNTFDWAYGLCVYDNYAYVTGDLFFQIIDISDPENPSLMRTIRGLRPPNNIDVVGNYAYVISLQSGLHIYNVANPANPILLGSCENGDFFRDIKVRGYYAYTAGEMYGLNVIIISYPANPQFNNSFSLPSSALSVYILGDYAYIADDYAGVYVIDISNPLHPAFAGRYNTPGHAQGIFASGDYIYVADEDSLIILYFPNSSIDTEMEISPREFTLEQNYPNPFNSRTEISYSISRPGNVLIEIVDIMGRRLSMMKQIYTVPGKYSVIFDASQYSSGIYFYRLTSENAQESKRMTLIK